MATIVEYSNQKRPANRYPRLIVSPLRPSPCCFIQMEPIGIPFQEDGRCVYQYRRCRQCGFTVRAILRELPDPGLLAALRMELENAFVRNVPD